MTKKIDPYNKKYTPELVKQLLTYIEAGNYITTACAAVGISQETYRAWKRRYPSFAEEASKAEAVAMARNVTIIQVAAKTQWQAAAWFLERKAYKEMEDLLITEIDGVEVTAQIALTKLMKLRQVTAGFLYSATGAALQIGSSSKLKELEEVLEELGSQPVIIWVQFHHEVTAIQKLISDKYGANQVTTLYSETPDRDESINKFKNNEVRYLIAHPRSAAHGLTFVNCSAMVFFSLDYSYEAHAQARDRIHRIGQSKSCLYVYLVAKDSIDEELLKVLQRKQSLQDVVYGIVRKKAKGKSPRNA